MGFSLKKFKVSSIILKTMALICVISIGVLAIMIEVYAIRDIYATSLKITKEYSKNNTIIKDSLKALDLVLLGVMFITISLSMFELYIKKLDNFPDWLKINDLDDLKKLMIKMIIFVMAVSFTGKLVTYSNGPYIAYLGAGFALVVFSLTYFLKAKN